MTTYGLDEAIQADRRRQQAIIDLPVARGREALAKTLAFSTSLDVEAAIATLNAARALARTPPRRRRKGRQPISIGTKQGGKPLMRCWALASSVLDSAR